MSKLRWAAIGLGLAVMVSAQARAADYPFTGLFNFPPDDAAAADSALFCAYNFFAQNPDGSYVNYHLDLPRYRKDGTIRFLVFTRGQCSAENGKVETCTTRWDVDPKNEGASFFDVIQTIGPASVQVAYFDSLADARSFAGTGKPPPSSMGKYNRCPFDADAIARYRTDEESSISNDDREGLVTPKLDADTRATMTRVLTAIRDGQ